MVSRIFLAFMALGLGFVGVSYLIDPNILLVRYELSVADAGMDNMLRSAYGGFFLATAFYILLGAARPVQTRDTVGLVCLLMTGAALGRVVSIAVMGMAHPMITNLLVFEVVTAVLAAVLYVRSQPAAAT